MWSPKGLQLLLWQKQKPVFGRTFGSHEDGLLVGLDKVVLNCSMTQEGGVGASQQGMRTTDLDWGRNWTMWEKHLEKLLNFTDMPSVEETQFYDLQALHIFFVIDNQKAPQGKLPGMKESL